MKKPFFTLGVTLPVSLIVISLLLPVNHSVYQASPSNAFLIADGSPLPPTPPPPPPTKGNQLMLDGSPLPPVPPPPPQKLSNGAMTLDGSPLPPVPPPPPKNLDSGRFPVDDVLEQMAAES
jgi:hypothetical protein